MMYQKQVVENAQKPYSARQIENLRKAFKGLERARYSKSVQAYTKKLLSELKG